MTAETAAVEPGAPSCRNCGAPAPGAYCPRCGQETVARLPKFTQFMREAAGRYVALDGRLWKTLAALLFRPGFLTREYLAGRRRRYIRPARLFLVTSLLLFAVLRLFVELQGVEVLNLNSSADAEAPAQSRSPAKADGSPAAKPAAKAEAAAREVGEMPASGPPAGDGEHKGRLRAEDDINLDLAAEIPPLRKRIARFNRLSGEEKEAQIVDGIFRYGPYAMFALLPAFAVLLKVLYLGRRRRYPDRPRLYSEHLVFAAHSTAFLSLGVVAATAAPWSLPRAGVILWMLVYLPWSMRVVYAGSWLGIAARAFTIFIAYSVLFGLVTAGLVVTAVVLR
jgi:hypothetical protein